MYWGLASITVRPTISSFIIDWVEYISLAADIGPDELAIIELDVVCSDDYRRLPVVPWKDLVMEPGGRLYKWTAPVLKDSW